MRNFRHPVLEIPWGKQIYLPGTQSTHVETEEPMIKVAIWEGARLKSEKWGGEEIEIDDPIAAVVEITAEEVEAILEKMQDPHCDKVFLTVKGIEFATTPDSIQVLDRLH